MPEYVVSEGCRVVHRGSTAEAGQKITLTEEQAAPLLADGRLTRGGHQQPEQRSSGVQQAPAGKVRRREADDG